MSRMCRLVSAVLFLVSTSLAAQRSTVSLPITAAMAGEKVRFSSPSTVCQIRVQILSSAGEALFDSSWSDGNVLDVPIDNLLYGGSYRCIITVKDLEGQTSEREAKLVSQNGHAAIEGSDKSAARVTLLAHDGTTGSVVTTSGDLSFRFGDFLTAKDVQKMRLTSEGDLRVDGLVRAKGFVFPDGTVLTTADAAASSGGAIVRQQPAGSGAGKNVEARPPILPLAPSPNALKPKPNASGYNFVVSDTGVNLGGASGNFSLHVNGTISSTARYLIGGATMLSGDSTNTLVGEFAGNGVTGNSNSILGALAGYVTSTGSQNSFFGYSAGYHVSTGLANSFFGFNAGISATTESNNSAFGDFTDILAGVTNSTAIGANAKALQSNTVILGSINGVNSATATSSTGIATQTPNQYLGVGGGVTIDENNTNNGTLATNTVLAFGSNLNTGGVSGEAIASQRSAGAGQYGIDFYTGYAKRMTIFSSGNVQIVGMLTKGSGSFKIDHPLDPENKYLYHSFVESPDMKNIYDGVAILDVNGQAIVELPEWFEALNQDFRYQLTCMHGFAPVYIDEEISGNRFKIAGGKPGMKVSWQVTGIRHDAFANAHRIPVEEEKPGAERGTYLHPAEFGQPPERGVTHAQAVN